MISAWGDESGSNVRLDPGTYILGAAISFDQNVDDARQTMEQLRLPAESKIHWHSDDDRRHRSVIEAIAAMPVEGFVVVRNRPGGRPEHGRRKCLEALLSELESLGCGQLTLESRGRADDRRDHKMMQYIRQKKHPGSRVRLDHIPGPKDPMLWIADALCGAVVSSRCGQPQHLKMLETTTEVKIIDP